MKNISFDEFLNQMISIPVVQESEVEYLSELDIQPGLICEFGVFTGNSLCKIANLFKDNYVFGFDIFTGLPENWERSDFSYPKGSFFVWNYPMLPPNVYLIPGLFNETIPKFVNHYISEQLSFIHIDCKLYNSAKDIFDKLNPLFQENTIILFSDSINYPSYENHVIKAFYEYLLSSNYDVEFIAKSKTPFDKNPIEYIPGTTSFLCKLKKTYKRLLDR
jgi:hypothetical protein